MDLHNLSRKELQQLAKENGIKANLKSSAIIELLEPILNQSSGEISKNENETNELLDESQIIGQADISVVHEDITTNATSQAEKVDVTTSKIPAQDEPESICKTNEKVESETSQTLTRPAIPAEKRRPTTKFQETKQSTNTNIKQNAATISSEDSIKPAQASILVRNSGSELKRGRDDTEASKENGPSSCKKVRIVNRFEKAHERLFNAQKSITEYSGKTPKSSVKKTQPKCYPKTPLAPIDMNQAVSTDKKAPAKKIVFDLEASLKRPVTWKMKRGPIQY